MKSLAVLFLLVFALHLGTVFILSSVALPLSLGSPDYEEYQDQAVQIAGRLSHGNFSVRGLGLDHYFPVTVGYLYFIFGSNVIVGQIWNGTLASLAALLLYGMMREIGGSKKAALFTAFGASIYPTYLLFTSLLVEDALALVFALASLWAGLRALRSFNWPSVFLWCVFTFLTASVRSFMGLFVGVSFLISLIFLSALSNQQKIKWASLVIVFLFIAMPFVAELVTMVSGYLGYGHSFNNQFREMKSFWNALLALPRTLLAPFPWNVKDMKDVFFLTETIPWYIVLPFALKGMRRAKERIPRALLIAVFSAVMFVAVALYINDEGMMMRLRVPAVLTSLVFISLVIFPEPKKS